MGSLVVPKPFTAVGRGEGRFCAPSLGRPCPLPYGILVLKLSFSD